MNNKYHHLETEANINVIHNLIYWINTIDEPNCLIAMNVDDINFLLIIEVVKFFIENYTIGKNDFLVMLINKYNELRKINHDVELEYQTNLNITEILNKLTFEILEKSFFSKHYTKMEMIDLLLSLKNEIEYHDRGFKNLDIINKHRIIDDDNDKLFKNKDKELDMLNYDYSNESLIHKNKKKFVKERNKLKEKIDLTENDRYINLSDQINHDNILNSLYNNEDKDKCENSMYIESNIKQINKNKVNECLIDELGSYNQFYDKGSAKNIKYKDNNDDFSRLNYKFKSDENKNINLPSNNIDEKKKNSFVNSKCSNLKQLFIQCKNSNKNNKNFQINLETYDSINKANENENNNHDTINSFYNNNNIKHLNYSEIDVKTRSDFNDTDQVNDEIILIDNNYKSSNKIPENNSNNNKSKVKEKVDKDKVNKEKVDKENNKKSLIYNNNDNNDNNTNKKQNNKFEKNLIIESKHYTNNNGKVNNKNEKLMSIENTFNDDSKKIKIIFRSSSKNKTNPNHSKDERLSTIDQNIIIVQNNLDKEIKPNDQVLVIDSIYSKRENSQLKHFLGIEKFLMPTRLITRVSKNEFFKFNPFINYTVKRVENSNKIIKKLNQNIILKEELTKSENKSIFFNNKNFINVNDKKFKSITDICDNYNLNLVCKNEETPIKSDEILNKDIFQKFSLTPKCNNTNSKAKLFKDFYKNNDIDINLKNKEENKLEIKYVKSKMSSLVEILNEKPLEDYLFADLKKLNVPTNLNLSDFPYLFSSGVLFSDLINLYEMVSMFYFRKIKKSQE